MNRIGHDPIRLILFRAPIGPKGLARTVKGNESSLIGREGVQ